MIEAGPGKWQWEWRDMNVFQKFQGVNLIRSNKMLDLE